MTLSVRLAVLPLVAAGAAFAGWLLQFLWGLLLGVLPTPRPPLSFLQKVVHHSAGLIAIVWMLGVYQLLTHVPDTFFRFKPSWLLLLLLLGAWLGVGLLLAVSGLRCGSSACRVCALLAICVFIYFVWQLLFPPYEVGVAEVLPKEVHSVNASIAFLFHIVHDCRRATDAQR